MNQKRKEKNNIPYIIDVTGEKEPRVVYGKGRNSVSHKLFGIRAYPAIQNGFAKSISKATQLESKRS
jgi:hypothetical protein